MTNERETYARIIDPGAWKLLDAERHDPPKRWKNEGGMDWLRYYERGTQASLAKADQIIAARAAISKAEGRTP